MTGSERWPSVRTELERARELLDGIDRRHDYRNRTGNVGEWQTELNEVSRILHEIIDHLDPLPPTFPEPQEPDDY